MKIRNIFKRKKKDEVKAPYDPKAFMIDVEPTPIKTGVVDRAGNMIADDVKVRYVNMDKPKESKLEEIIEMKFRDDDPITVLYGIGTAKAELLATKNIKTVGDISSINPAIFHDIASELKGVTVEWLIRMATKSRRYLDEY